MFYHSVLKIAINFNFSVNNQEIFKNLKEKNYKTSCNISTTEPVALLLELLLFAFIERFI